MKERKNTGEFAHYSDRCIEYYFVGYQELHRHDVFCSMTDGYDCYQSVLTVRDNGILEYLLNNPNDLDEAKKMVAESVKIYNELGLTPLKYKTPDEVYRAF